ncbi:MAG: glycosyltransferase family 4 protein [Actinomycetota bacterium]
MTTLMVSPYPPYRDGIGSYTVQEVRRMRAAGEAVEVLSPLPSAAEHHLPLGDPAGVMRLVRRAGRFRRVVVQFSPEMFFGACRSPLQRVAVWTALGVLARRVRLEIRLHEIEFGPLERNPAERMAAARALRATNAVTVHTQPEADRLRTVLGLGPRDVTLVDHGRNFEPTTRLTRIEARRELGLAAEPHLFLAIGFLQAHKGFDRAVNAFARAGVAGRAELHVVGSVRVEHPDLLAHAALLRRLAGATPGAQLHEAYVSDTEFDQWIAASDTVVLPYREIWSSSVMERAKLWGRPVIATDVGGLGDQAPDDSIVVANDDELAAAMETRVRTTAARRSTGGDHTISITADGGLAEERDPGRAALWAVDQATPDRRDIEAQISERARQSQLSGVGAVSAPGHGRAGGSGGLSSAIDPLLSLGPFVRPVASSPRRGVGRVKRLIRSALNWELDPMARQLEELRQATIEAVAAMETSTHADLARSVSSEPADRAGGGAPRP